MQILSIHLKNIKSHRDLELQFSPGINVLSGPNGVGKSTIFEAIGYALFGVDAQSFVGNIERFVSIGAKKGEIKVTFQPETRALPGQPHGRHPGQSGCWKRKLGGSFEVEEHKDVKETEARLKELLGLDNGRLLAEQFQLVIGPFQNEFLGPFVDKQPRPNAATSSTRSSASIPGARPSARPVPCSRRSRAKSRFWKVPSARWLIRLRSCRTNARPTRGPRRI